LGDFCTNRDANLEACTCTYEPCSRKGLCCECMRYHLKLGEVPGCFFSKEDERSYDRTIARFVASNS